MNYYICHIFSFFKVIRIDVFLINCKDLNADIGKQQSISIIGLISFKFNLFMPRLTYCTSHFHLISQLGLRILRLQTIANDTLKQYAVN